MTAAAGTTTERSDPLTAACSGVDVSPLQRGVLSTAVRDLALAVGWCDLRVMLLPGTQWVVIVGHKRREDALRAVLPIPLHSTALTPSALHAIFGALGGLTLDALPPVMGELAPSVEELRKEYATLSGKEGDGGGDSNGSDAADAGAAASNDLKDTADGIDTDTLYVAIGSPDSTVVYYKLSRGIKKPADIPDE